MTDSQFYFIAGLLQDPDQLWEVRDKVDPLYLSGNERKIYEAICHDPDLDIIALSQESGVDATKYQSDEFIDLKWHAERIKSDYIESQFPSIERVLGDAYKTPQDRLSEARDIIGGLSGVMAEGKEKKFTDALKEADEQLRNKEGGLTGITTGFQRLNDKMHGWNSKRFYIVAGRPGMGKSAFALNSIIKSEKKTLLFSLEMSASEIASRMIQMQARQNEHDYQDGRVDWDKHRAVVDELQDENLTIVDRTVDMDEIEAITKRLAMKGEVEQVYIDYLQRVTGPKGINRNEQLGHMSNRCKGLSMDLDIPVIALAQLNRKCEERPDKRPILSDLKESGDLEQDADLVMFCYRPHAYEGVDPPDDADGDYGLLIAKQRNGPIGDVWLSSDMRHYRIDESSSEEKNAPF